MNRCGWFVLLCLCLACPLAAQPGIAPPPISEETDIGKLTQHLKTGDEQARSAALNRLRDLNAPKLTDLLLLAMQDASESVRWTAVELLQDRLTPEVVATLLELLKTGRAEIRPQAARALYSCPEPRVTDALLAALKTEAPPARVQAIQALEERDDPRILPALLAATRDADPGTRAAAVRGVRFFPTEDTERRIIKLLKDPEMPVRLSAANTIAEMVRNTGEIGLFSQAVPALIDLLADENGQVRQTAAGTLAVLKDPRAVPPLIAALPRVKAEDRWYIIGALGDLRDLRAVQPLLDFVVTNDDQGAGQVAGAIARIGKPAIPLCIAAYDQAQEPARRLLILRLLRDMRTPYAMDPDVVKLFARVFTGEKDVALRIAAVQDLRAMDYPQVVPALCAALRDPDPQLRKAAVNSLQTDTEPATTEALLPLLKDPVKEVQLAALYAAGYRDDPRVKQAMTALAGDADPQIRIAVLRNLHSVAPDLLVHAMRDKDAGVRGMATSRVMEIYARCNAGDRTRLLTGLIERLKDTDGEIRQQATTILGWIADPRGIDPLIQALRHDAKPEVREYAAHALGQIGDDRVVEPLLQAIHDPVEWARSAAKDELGEIGDTRAIPVLQALNDTEPWRTAGALARLGVTKDIPVPAGFSKEEWAVVAPVFAREWLSTGEYAALLQRQPGIVDILRAFLDRSTREDGYQMRVMDALAALNPHVAAETIARLYQRMTNRGRGLNAINVLGRLHDPAAVQPLINELSKALRNGEGNIVSLISTLGAYDDPRILPLLKEIRGTDDVTLRYLVAGLLARRGDAEAMAFLLAPLDKLGRMEKYSAIRALGASGDPRALEVLLKEFEKGEERYNYLLGAALDSWLRIHPDAYEQIAPLLAQAAAREKDGYTRLDLLRPLIEHQDPRAVDNLLATVFEMNDEDAVQAIGYLAHYRGEKIVDTLVKVLADGNLGQRQAAATALAIQADPRAVPALLRAVREDTTRVRLQAIRSLGTLKAKEAIPALIPLLAEKGTRIITAAADALHAITGQDFGTDAGKWQVWWKEQ